MNNHSWDNIVQVNVELYRIKSCFMGVSLFSQLLSFQWLRTIAHYHSQK